MSWRVALLVLSSAALGCGQPASPAPPPAAAAPEPAKPQAQTPEQAPAQAAPAVAAPSDRIDDPTFELRATPVGEYAAGKLASFAVQLRPRGVYHINQDYPLSIKVTGEGLAFPKAELAKPDAAEITERVARFDVPFTPSAAGSHRVEANVKFAVCTPENCVPDERTLALVLAVQ